MIPAGPLSASDEERARLRVFDTLGAIAAGRTLPDASGALGGGPVGGGPAGGGPVDAVRRLCASTRATEVDDIDRRTCTTPGSVAVTVALLVGAACDAPAGRLLAGVAAGYAAMVAVGEVADGARALYRGIWPSYLGAPVAAAATAGTVLGLDDDRLRDALAIAAARATSVVGRPPREPTSRWFVFGCAAADGVLAAFAAQRGMSGDPDVLRTVAGDVTSGGTASGGASDAVARVDVKPFCTARQTQAAVQAAVLASAQLGDVALDAVEVAVPEDYRAMIDRPVAADRLTSMMSAQFQIAAALTDDALLYDVARAAPRLPAAGAALMSRVTVVADAELSAAYPETWPARVTLRARDGRELTRQVDDPDEAGWESLSAKHARLGALGDRLETSAGVCRALGGDRRGDARRLLELIDEPPTPTKED